MDFRNKYLKYKPEITFDIFQKVWDKLIESGYLPVGKYDVERGFGDFKTLHCYLRTTDSHPMEFNCYSIPALFWVETTVQEILGYDPFVKDDDFVLPEKWCCKITEESIEIFNNWRISMSKYYLQNRIDKKYPYITNNGSCNYTTMGTEITFDQFKKYVLKQNVEKGKEVIPEYVEALIDVSGYFIKGNIYKVESSQNIKSCRLISNIKSGSESAGTILLVDLSNNNRFEPSTKSAFDLQNQPKQPIKQAVHCETQEQWDFVIEKVGYSLCKNDFNEYKSESCVILNSKNHMGSLKWATKENYQILSFSDWCAQNNYEFQSKLESFYVVCETEKESDLCLMWAVDNGLVCDTRRVFISGDFNVFEVYNGTATINMRLRSVSAKNNKHFEDIIHQNLTSAIPSLSEKTANNLSETIDRLRYMAMQKAQTETLDEMFCASIDEVSKSLDNYTNKNKIQISTDNEIKINIIQKQSIKI